MNVKPSHSSPPYTANNLTLGARLALGDLTLRSKNHACTTTIIQPNQYHKRLGQYPEVRSGLQKENLSLQHRSVREDTFSPARHTQHHLLLLRGVYHGHANKKTPNHHRPIRRERAVSRLEVFSVFLYPTTTGEARAGQTPLRFRGDARRPQVLRNSIALLPTTDTTTTGMQTHGMYVAQTIIIAYYEEHLPTTAAVDYKKIFFCRLVLL